jgi:hypothetical protein
VFPDQTEGANLACKAHEWPGHMPLLLELFLLLMLSLCVSEKPRRRQPCGPCLNLHSADPSHHTIILGDKANCALTSTVITNARDAYLDFIRAETVSIRTLLFELLVVVAPGG